MMMAAFSRVSLDEARRFVLPPRRATQESVRGLTAESAGQLELGSDDRSITERARLKAAAQAVGKTLEIRRQGNMMVFWGTDEPPKTRTKSAAAQIGRGKRR
jgi:hypothetical protein